MTTFQSLYEIIKKRSPIYSTLWLKSREDFGEQWETELSTNIANVFGETHNPQWEEAVNGYISFCNDALKAQAFFEKNGRYKATSYAECLALCYHSPDYMKLRYLPGQYLSHYIWPHHQRMRSTYVEKLLPSIKDEVSLFYEVGVGCGMYSQKTLEAMPSARGVGFDISGYALEFTKRVVDASGFGDRYEVRNQNIIDSTPEEKADFTLSQEVLEHLEDPVAFIAGLHQSTRPGGWGYITAAINAAHTDHIYLYRSPEQLIEQIKGCGWTILDVQVEENYPEKPKEFRPTIAGCLVRKAS